jgi:hypothetical protein
MPLPTGNTSTDLATIILMRRGQCTPVPKAAFRSPGDLERFRTLLAERMTPGA